MTPAQIRRMRIAAEARVEKARAQLATALKEAELFRQLEGLHPDVTTSTIASDRMQAEARNIAISAGRSGKDPFLAAIRAKGYTLRSLADTLDCQHSLLSMQRKGERPIPYERARTIEKLTGWPAKASHWPGGLS